MRRFSLDRWEARVVKTSHVRRALVAQVVLDLRSIVEYSLVFSPFSTSFRSSLTLVDSSRPAKLRILLQLFKIGWMKLACSTQQGLEVFVFFFADHL